MSASFEPDAETIDKIIVLANEASAAQLLQISRTFEDDGLPETVPALYDPETRRANSLRDVLESYRQRPARKTGVAQVTTRTAFIDLVNHHKTEASVIFAKAEWPGPSLTAVIDYHKASGAPTDANRLGHRIHYAFPLTPEFESWVEHSGKPMDQATFATFLEDRIVDLSAPDAGEAAWFKENVKATVATPADIITTSRGLQVTVGQKVKTSYNPRTGEAVFSFEEEHAQAGTGEKVDVPGGFIVAIAPFRFGEKIRLFARLRYRVKDGAVLWFYHLYRWEDELVMRVTADLERVHKDTGLPTFVGQPEA